MEKRLLILITLFLLLTIPSNALAQGTEPQPGVAPTMPGWDQIPDVIQPVALDVPQCCEQDNFCPAPPDDPDAGWNLGELIIKTLDWVFIRIWQSFYCVFLDILQHLANLLSWMINAVVRALNWIIRLIIWLWFGLRISFWNILSFINILIEIINNIYGFLLWIIDILWIVLQFLWEIIIFIIDIIKMIISLISYIIAIAFSFVGEILEYILHGDNVPLIVEETGPHVAYATFRGIIDAILDSKIAFLVYLAIASCYVAWATWFLKYLPSGDTK